MHWLITGGAGMLGTDVTQLLQARGEEVTALGSAELDIRDLAAVRAAVAGHDVVVNAAAWTNVDGAETHEAEAFSVNAVGAFNVALASREAGARLAHVSTDYVFDGTATAPYPVDAPIAPQSAYGRTKAAGEWAVQSTHPDAHVIRTAWLYGAHGPNFVSTMLRLAGERETLTVVDDQTGSPTSTADLAKFIVAVEDSALPGGVLHGTNTGQVTWCGFAQEIFRLNGLDPARVQPCTTADFPRPAPRPAWSVLEPSTSAYAMPSWQQALSEHLG